MLAPLPNYLGAWPPCPPPPFPPPPPPPRASYAYAFYHSLEHGFTSREHNVETAMRSMSINTIT